MFCASASPLNYLLCSLLILPSLKWNTPRRLNEILLGDFCISGIFYVPCSSYPRVVDWCHGTATVSWVKILTRENWLVWPLGSESQDSCCLIICLQHLPHVWTFLGHKGPDSSIFTTLLGVGWPWPADKHPPNISLNLLSHGIGVGERGNGRKVRRLVGRDNDSLTERGKAECTSKAKRGIHSVLSIGTHMPSHSEKSRSSAYAIVC